MLAYYEDSQSSIFSKQLQASYLTSVQDPPLIMPNASVKH